MCVHVCACAHTHTCTSSNGYLFLLPSCLSLFLWCPGLRPDSLPMAQPSSGQSLPCLLNPCLAVGALTMGLAHRKPITQVQPIYFAKGSSTISGWLQFPQALVRESKARDHKDAGEERSKREHFHCFGVFFLGVFLGVLALLMALMLEDALLPSNTSPFWFTPEPGQGELSSWPH